MTFGAIWKILTDVVHIAVLLGWLVLLGMWLTWREDFDDIEGALFPVVTATSIIESKPADNGLKTHLRLEFIKPASGQWCLLKAGVTSVNNQPTNWGAVR